MLGLFTGGSVTARIPSVRRCGPTRPGGSRRSSSRPRNKGVDETMNDGEIRIGVIGCGGFGLYALQQFAQVPGVKLTGMAGTHREAALAAARRFGIPDIEDIEKLLARDAVELVYIATPPFLHYPQALAALEAGKHVICEKPLALSIEQADAMIALAGRRDRL